MSVVTTVNKVVENLAHFLSPYLKDILSSVSTGTHVHVFMFQQLVKWYDTMYMYLHKLENAPVHA